MATSKIQSKKASTTRPTTRRKTTKKAATAPEAKPDENGDDAATQAATEAEVPSRRTRRRKKVTVATATAESAPPDETPSDGTSDVERFPPVYATEGDDGRVETLGDLSAAYCRALEVEGKSETTIRSYRADLALALSILGADTRLADLTPEMVSGFNEHPRVTQTRDGHPKAKTGMLKHRRVLRLALVWAAENGHVGVEPLPANGDAE
jgi:hypothetical protein